MKRTLTRLRRVITELAAALSCSESVVECAELAYGDEREDPALVHCLVFIAACHQLEMRLTDSRIGLQTWLARVAATRAVVQPLARLLATAERPLGLLLTQLESELSACELQVDGLVELFEGLLAASAPDVRRRSGVFHTPSPLGRYMVGQLDAALKECGLPGGLLENGSYGELGLTPPERVDRKNKACILLEPAAGLGVILGEVVRHVARPPGKPSAGAMAGLLKRMRAVELMPALHLLTPFYLRCVLAEQGYDPALAQHCQLYRADFLSSVIGKSPWLVGVTVVLGNPPYARSSANKGQALRDLLAPYRRGLEGERNLQPLADDYIKFMRAVEVVLQPAPTAFFSLVTNHSYLRGRLHRSMRSCLRQSFERIDVLDLHGNTKVRRPGERDENVFGIAQGIAVTLGCRAHQRRERLITYRELRGRRVDKLSLVREGRLPQPQRLNVHQCKFSPSEPLPREYGEFVPLDDLFEFYSVGGKPGDDGMLVGFESEQLLSQLRSARTRVEHERARSTEAARRLSQRPLSEPFLEDGVIHYAYRPFDERVAYYEPRIWTRPLRALYARVDGRPILLTTRIVKGEDFAHVFVTRRFPDVIALSPTSSVNCYAFPLATMEPEPLRRATGMCLSQEEAFAYVYAALHSGTYRRRYLGGLRDDFPRIPVMKDPALIASLVARGGRLLALHLGEAKPKAERPRFVDGGDRRIRCEVPQALGGGSGGTLKLGLNDESAFEALPEAAWSFRVGGYQVCRKWLLDRRRAGRDLTDEDVDRYCDLVARVQETVTLQRDIDALIDRFGGFPRAVLPRPR